MAARLNTCTTLEQRGIVRFCGQKYGSKGYPQRNVAHLPKWAAFLCGYPLLP
jgi:peptide subunit release factor 1 (eRF1)